jgi:MFS family permease
MAIAVASMLAMLVPVSLLLRPKPPDEHEPIFGITPAPQQTAPEIPSDNVSPFRLATLMHSSAFITVSVPFALALTAQVGFLTHQVAFLSATIGTVAAGWVVSLTTFAAVVGRIATGYIADRFDRRVVACGNFIVQALGLGFLAAAASPTPLYLGCVLFGLGVGNTTSLPGLLVQQEFPKQHFARIVSAVVAINQFSFAFGPIVLGQLERMAGSYLMALAVCLLVEMLAAAIVVSPVLLRRMRRTAVPGWRHCEPGAGPGSPFNRTQLNAKQAEPWP